MNRIVPLDSDCNGIGAITKTSTFKNLICDSEYTERCRKIKNHQE
jgi:hypothetical protein